MYIRFALKLCERGLHRTLINSRLRSSILSHDTKRDIEKQTMELTSQRFPGYRLIYVFPYIAHAGALNSAKRRCTYVAGAVIPAMIGLNLMDVIPFNTTYMLIANGKVLYPKLQ